MCWLRHWTHLRCEGSKGSKGGGGALRAQIIKKGARPRRGLCRRVVSPQGKRLTMICASLVLLQIMFAVHRFAQGATALRAEGGGIALSGDEYKVSVTGLAFCVIWHDWHSGDWLTAFASPFPATRDFPLCRGQNKTPRDNLLINPPLEMTKEPCHPTVMLKRKARLAPESLAVRMQKKRSSSFRGASFFVLMKIRIHSSGIRMLHHRSRYRCLWSLRRSCIRRGVLRS